MIASFVFALSVYAVKGYAAHANTSNAARRRPPNRMPTSARPRIVRTSNAIEVACAAGSESHFPLQPKIDVAGT